MKRHIVKFRNVIIDEVDTHIEARRIEVACQKVIHEFVYHLTREFLNIDNKAGCYVTSYTVAGMIADNSLKIEEENILGEREENQDE